MENVKQLPKKKRLKNLAIEDLLQLLHMKVQQRLNDITALGIQAKELANANKDKEEAIYRKMTILVQELQPVEHIIRKQHPKMGELFDSLLELYGPKSPKEIHGS